MDKKLMSGFKDAFHNIGNTVNDAISQHARPNSYPDPDAGPLPMPTVMAPQPFNPSLDRPPPSVKLIKQGLNGEGPLNVHDPNVIRAQDGMLFMFGTGKGPGDSQIPYWRTSRLASGTWEFLGWALAARPASAKSIPWARAPGANDGFWAPEVAFFNGKYWLYYAYSNFGTNNSAIGLVSTLSLNDRPIAWQDEGLVVQSPSRLGNFNAIDAAVLNDPQGRLWMSWGSFWDGIFMQELNAQTGHLLDPNARPVHVAARPGVKSNPIEGATLAYRRANNSFYMFVAYDYCCPADGAVNFRDKPYRVAVGRSTSGPLGPYVDRNGMSMVDGGHWPLVARRLPDLAELPGLPTAPGAGPGSCCYEMLPAADAARIGADGFAPLANNMSGRSWKGMGGASVLLDQPDRPDLVFVHSYLDGAAPWLRCFELGWDGDWPYLKWTADAAI
eukprot:TRINITY_DN9872_c0_g1_i2.p1 TRINITY_DN9872_c0_g1~~TRINITY_DN9872_c0_g1_i2.p1  ORF type:complete len:443 (+),score=93.58 TRINITY_DN9872_c0_g1_i2:130-1458(+)